MKRTWVIVGATSVIAEHFAHCAAQEGHSLCLAGRQEQQLKIIAEDIQLRYQVACDRVLIDCSIESPLKILENISGEFDLFIAQSDITENAHLNPQSIKRLISVNIETSIVLIDFYLNHKQSQHNLLYLSSVAACRGRGKNSLYGASKACVEIYLEGLQQTAPQNQCISIARLGFIDTRQTYGQPGIFYAGSPKTCAKACWNALKKKKRIVYVPFFWRGIMAIITRLPFFIYKQLKI